jgi:hypothetical protein
MKAAHRCGGRRSTSATVLKMESWCDERAPIRVEGPGASQQRLDSLHDVQSSSTRQACSTRRSSASRGPIVDVVRVLNVKEFEEFDGDPAAPLARCGGIAASLIPQLLGENHDSHESSYCIVTCGHDRVILPSNCLTSTPYFASVERIHSARTLDSVSIRVRAQHH